MDETSSKSTHISISVYYTVQEGFNLLRGVLHGVSKQDSLQPCRSPCEAAKDMTTQRQEHSIYYGMLDVIPHRYLYQSMKHRGLIAENARFSPLSVIIDRAFLCLFSTSFHPQQACCWRIHSPSGQESFPGQEIFMARYGIKIIRQEHELFLLTGGMRTSRRTAKRQL